MKALTEHQVALALGRLAGRRWPNADDRALARAAWPTLSQLPDPEPADQACADQILAELGVAAR